MSNLGRKLTRSLAETADIWQLYKGRKTKFEIFKIWLNINPIFEPIHFIISFFNVQKERVQRLYTYGKYLWDYGEFDWEYHVGLWELSLIRLQDTLKNGTSVHTKKSQRKLQMAINCLKRMRNTWDYYYEPADKAFQQRWGFCDSFELLEHPTHKNRFYTSRHQFRNSLTQKEQVRFDKEYKELLRLEDKMFKRDSELFGKLLSKHMQKWWN